MKTFSKINLNNKHKILIKLFKSGISVSLLRANGSEKALFIFDEVELQGLNYLSDDKVVKFLSEKIALDLNVDEVIDTCESIKDNIKLLFKENPDLIDYSRNVYISDEISYQEKNRTIIGKINFGNSSINLTKPPGWLILIVLLFLAMLIGQRQSISCSFQGGKVVEYKPVYQIVSTGQTLNSDSLEYACVKKTSAGYRTLFQFK